MSLISRRSLFDDMFDDSWIMEPFWSVTPSNKQQLSNKLDKWIPRCDIKETENSIEIHAELPGMKKDDLNIEIDDKNGLMTISGESK
mgnify:CR=1 FL=1